MKIKPLLIPLFVCCYLSALSQNSFNWTDTVFAKGAIKTTKRVEFGLDDSGIRKECEDSLKPLVQFMLGNKFLKLEIGYHTDPQGQYKHNMILSQNRAQAIVNYLISQGIDSARLVAKGYGSTKPLPGCSALDIAKMKTKEAKQAAYQADRRTEVKIIAPDSGNIFKWNDIKFMKYSRREIKIIYGLDSAKIRKDSLSTLSIDSVVKFLKSHSYLKAAIYVHTDPIGAIKHNMILSQARAESVKDWLISLGVDSTQIIAKGWGSKRPLYKVEYPYKMKCADCFDNRPPDRRTEIVILGMRR